MGKYTGFNEMCTIYTKQCDTGKEYRKINRSLGVKQIPFELSVLYKGVSNKDVSGDVTNTLTKYRLGQFVRNKMKLKYASENQE